MKILKNILIVLPFSLVFNVNSNTIEPANFTTTATVIPVCSVGVYDSATNSCLERKGAKLNTRTTKTWSCQSGRKSSDCSYTAPDTVNPTPDPEIVIPPVIPPVITVPSAKCGINNFTCIEGIAFNQQTTLTAYTWSCQGEINTANCSNSRTAPVCSSSTVNGCDTGSLVSGSVSENPLTFNWSCENEGLTSNCSINKPQNAVCSTSTVNSCENGTVSNIGQNASFFTWSCVADNTVNCQIAKTAPVCGTTTDSCSQGTVSNQQNLPLSFIWKCNNDNLSVDCENIKQPVCSSSNTLNSCDLGSVSATSQDSNKWYWTCSNGGLNQSCELNKPLPPVSTCSYNANNYVVFNRYEESDAGATTFVFNGSTVFNGSGDYSSGNGYTRGVIRQDQGALGGSSGQDRFEICSGTTPPPPPPPPPVSNCSYNQTTDFYLIESVRLANGEDVDRLTIKHNGNTIANSVNLIGYTMPNGYTQGALRETFTRRQYFEICFNGSTPPTPPPPVNTGQWPAENLSVKISDSPVYYSNCPTNALKYYADQGYFTHVKTGSCSIGEKNIYFKITRYYASTCQTTLYEQTCM